MLILILSGYIGVIRIVDMKIVVNKNQGVFVKHYASSGKKSKNLFLA